jgi:hypothetical protein
MSKNKIDEQQKNRPGNRKINDLATRQQRLVGYRQCLVDMKEENATPKNTGSG